MTDGGVAVGAIMVGYTLDRIDSTLVSKNTSFQLLVTFNGLSCVIHTGEGVTFQEPTRAEVNPNFKPWAYTL